MVDSVPESSRPNKLTPAIDLFIPSTRIIRDNFFTYLVLYILPFLFIASVFALHIGFTVTPATLERAAIIHFKGYFWYLIFGAALYNVLAYAPIVFTNTQAARGHQVTLREALRHGLPYAWRTFLLVLLTGLIVLGGLMLLIVPGIIFLRRYYLAPYYMIDRKLPMLEAMRQSAAESKLNPMAIYGLFGVNLAIGMVSLLTGVGEYISNVGQILYSAAPGLRYVEMTDHYKHHAKHASKASAGGKK